MRAPTTSELLLAWERGAGQASAQRALTLLSASGEMPRESLAALSIGERDALLFELREQLFGVALEAVVDCPSCAERAEIALDTRDLRTAAPHGAEHVHVEAEGFAIEARVPTGADLEALTSLDDPRRAHDVLFERCVVSVDRDGRAASVGDLSSGVATAVAEQLAAQDPQADLSLALDCPACGLGWTSDFDIAAFLWSEVVTWAERSLSDVHALATAYGWSEAEILALGPARRARYLALVNA